MAAPAPNDPVKRAELAKLLAGMESKYGSAKYCPSGPDSCRDQTQLKEVLEKSRNYDELLDGLEGLARPSRGRCAPITHASSSSPTKARANSATRTSARCGARVTTCRPTISQKEAARLYEQVEPLYKDLHCYARGRLAKKYGKDKVPAGKPIPAHLFGNMWAQQWNRVYDDLLKPYPGASTRRRRSAAASAEVGRGASMTKSAESFYTSIGFPALPQTFWERSMLTRPRDREVVCHASAWDMDDKDDVRIKMCIRPIEEDLFTIYHELGHVYYFLWYKDQPHLFQDGAHDGFHEAIGDTINLSMTPAYLREDRPGRRGAAHARKP